MVNEYNEHEELIILAKDLPHELINLPRPTSCVFWFGDFIRFSQQVVGCIYGVEYRPDYATYGMNSGYWYGCRWVKRESLQKIHESKLFFYDTLATYDVRLTESSN